MIKRAVIMIYAFVLIVLLAIHRSESTAVPEADPDADPAPAIRLIQLGEGPLLSRILSGVLGLVLNLLLSLLGGLLGGLGLVSVEPSDGLGCFNCGLNPCNGCG